MVDIVDEAQSEFNNAFLYYKDKHLELGVIFTHKFKTAIDNIEQFPLIYHQVQTNIRRALMDKFPFAIIYQIKGKVIFILALAHTSRKPNYWTNRET